MGVRRGPTTASGRAQDRLVTYDGLSMPLAPEGDRPALPSDVTLLSDSQLMGLFAIVTEYTNYVGSRLAASFIEERQAEEAVGYNKAMAMILGGEGKITVARARQEVDPQAVKLRQAHMDAYAYRKLLEALYAGLERDCALVSRELTRRTGGTAPTQRASKFTP